MRNQRYGKFNAKKQICRHGHNHDSKSEAERCDILHILQRKGRISGLQLQVRYELLPATKYEEFSMPNERSITYIADFVYQQDGLTVVEDVKGMKTPEYIMKRKMFKRRYCQDGKTIFIETHK